MTRENIPRHGPRSLPPLRRYMADSAPPESCHCGAPHHGISQISGIPSRFAPSPEQRNISGRRFVYSTSPAYSSSLTTLRALCFDRPRCRAPSSNVIDRQPPNSCSCISANSTSPAWGGKRVHIRQLVASTPKPFHAVHQLRQIFDEVMLRLHDQIEQRHHEEGQLAMVQRILRSRY